MKDALDLTPLVNACRRLMEGLARYELDTTDTQIRDGLIQRFEFTYETSTKMLKRYLESVAAVPLDFDSMAFADIIRTANEQSLLQGNWSDWRNYREMRGRSSHTYDESIALQVVAEIPRFLHEAQYLLGQLQERTAR